MYICVKRDAWSPHHIVTFREGPENCSRELGLAPNDDDHLRRSDDVVGAEKTTEA